MEFRIMHLYSCQIFYNLVTVYKSFSFRKHIRFYFIPINILVKQHLSSLRIPNVTYKNRGDFSTEPILLKTQADKTEVIYLPLSVFNLRGTLMNGALNLPLGSEAFINLSPPTNTQAHPRTCIKHANTHIIQKTETH